MNNNNLTSSEKIQPFTKKIIELKEDINASILFIAISSENKYFSVKNHNNLWFIPFVCSSSEDESNLITNNNKGWRFMSDKFDDIIMFKKNMELFVPKDVKNWQMMPFNHKPFEKLYIWPIFSNKYYYLLFFDNPEYEKLDNKLLKQYSLELQNLYLELKIDKLKKGRDVFVSNICHRIRTPLNTTLITTAWLTKELHKNQNKQNLSNQKKYLNLINMANMELNETVSDIIDISRLEINALKLKREVFNIRNCIKYAIKLIYIYINKKNGLQNNHVAIKINLNIDDKLPDFVYGDQKRLKQILINLLTNSVKSIFEKDNKNKEMINIYVSSESEVDLISHNIEFIISDTGKGIEENKIQNIFRSFVIFDDNTYYDNQKLKEKNSKVNSNTGISLLISKKLANLMNGDLWLLNTSEKGTKFKFNILLLEEEIPDYLKKKSLNRIKNKTVLIVESDTQRRIYLCKLISKWGMKYIQASSSDEVTMLHFSSSKKIDAAIINTNLNNSSSEGVKLAKKIRNLNYIFPIIAITFEDEEEMEDLNLEISLFHSIILLDYESDSEDEEVKNNNEFTNCIQNENDILISLLDAFSGKKSIFRTLKKYNSDKSINILIAEDDKMNQMVLEKLLNKMGYHNITIANNGREALNCVVKDVKKYDLFLFDIKMPKMDGYELSRHIHTIYTEQKLPIPTMLAVTAQLIFENDVEEGHYFDDFIEKPIEREDLYKKIKYVKQIHN